MVTKDDQLTLFLNIAYFGDKNAKPVYGFANAARSYFGKEFAALSDVERTSLVAMLIGPNYFKPGTPAQEALIAGPRLVTDVRPGKPL